MVLKLHPLLLTSSNVTTCPEIPTPQSSNLAYSHSHPIGRAHVEHDTVWALPNPFLFHQGAGRVLAQVQVTPVLPCSSFWVGFSSLG